MTDAERDTVRQKAGKIAQKALWKHFIKYYLEAYSFALSKNDTKGDRPQWYHF